MSFWLFFLLLLNIHLLRYKKLDYYIVLIYGFIINKFMIVMGSQLIAEQFNRYLMLLNILMTSLFSNKNPIYI